tara:strand:+ start:535 stop:1026 length:492 start_codon:yes stop_codon:yes gene_type:complete
LNIILIPIVVVVLDQISKIFVKNYWINNELFYSKINIIGEYVRIIYLENPGIAFGIDTSQYHFYITLLTFLAIVFLYFYYLKLISSNHYEKLSVSFIIGGAIGNFIDRFLVLLPNSGYNGVIDFIDVGIGYSRWYTFNVADASITIGLLIFFYQTYIIKKNDV